ncbi:hypothetical protein [Alsobacter sp. R-9]
MLHRSLRAVLALLALAAPGAALGDERGVEDRPMPVLDTARYCTLQAAANEGRYDRRQCDADEARSASIVGRQWAFMPDEVRINCASIARGERGSYFVLEACLRNYGRPFWRTFADEGRAGDRYQQFTKAFRR